MLGPVLVVILLLALIVGVPGWRRADGAVPHARIAAAAALLAAIALVLIGVI